MSHTYLHECVCINRFFKVSFFPPLERANVSLYKLFSDLLYVEHLILLRKLMIIIIILNGPDLYLLKERKQQVK